jgi:hypothetical protein
MKPPASFSTLASEFDAFLYAAIGEDRNGMPLSIVSALARMDLDPWHEAAGLAAVSVETATGKLTSLLAALPPILTGPSPGITAARLIALLPRRLDTNSRSPATKGGIAAATRPPPRMNVILLAIYMILMLGTQFALMRRPPPARADIAHAPAPPAAASHAPPIAPGK